MEDKKQFLDVDWLWSNKKMVHYFGLGFIQLKLNEINRVHFYTDELMKTVGDEEIHNHRYNFVSEILKGEFSQEIYDVEHVLDNGPFTHYLSQESCKEGDMTIHDQFPVNISKFYSEHLVAGEKYFMDHNSFHTVASSDAVTFLTRSGYKKELADVVFPKNRGLVCPFSIKLTQDEIFDILSSLLRK